jgi:PhnB protein
VTSIAPWLSVTNATEALAFYRAAFGAIELERLDDDAGDVVVAQLSIDGADFWIQVDAASSPEALNGASVRMILTVDDPDAVVAAALAAGATEVRRSTKATAGASGGSSTPPGTTGKSAGGCRADPSPAGVGWGLQRHAGPAIVRSFRRRGAAYVRRIH